MRRKPFLCITGSDCGAILLNAPSFWHIKRLKDLDGVLIAHAGDIIQSGAFSPIPIPDDGKFTGELIRMHDKMTIKMLDQGNGLALFAFGLGIGVHLVKHKAVKLIKLLLDFVP